MHLSVLTEKMGSLGAIVSAMGCASCFPLLGSLGATLGLGVLAQFEGLFINTLLPIFAIIALIAALASWCSHKRHFRGLLASAGPIMVLATLYLFWTASWSTYMFYIALFLMFVVAVLNLISPPHRACGVSTGEKNAHG